MAIKMDVSEKIIESVRRHRCLYDLQDKWYRNTVYKKRLWENIGIEVNLPGNVVRSKWKTLRDGYVKHKKNVQGTTGAGRKNYYYMWSDQLGFLDDTLKPRPTASNMTAVVEQSQPQQDTEEIGVTNQNQSSNEEVDELELDSSMEPTPRLIRALSSDTEIASGSGFVHSNLSSPSPPPPPPPPTALRHQRQSDIDKALDYLKNKKREVHDGVDHLFLSYASSFKTFPLHKQAALKIKLAQLFAETELDEAANQAISANQMTQVMLPSYSMISEDLQEESTEDTESTNSRSRIYTNL